MTERRASPPAVTIRIALRQALVQLIAAGSAASVAVIGYYAAMLIARQ